MNYTAFHRIWQFMENTEFCSVVFFAHNTVGSFSTVIIFTEPFKMTDIKTYQLQNINKTRNVKKSIRKLVLNSTC